MANFVGVALSSLHAPYVPTSISSKGQGSLSISFFPESEGRKEEKGHSTQPASQLGFRQKRIVGRGRQEVEEEKGWFYFFRGRKKGREMARSS